MTALFYKELLKILEGKLWELVTVNIRWYLRLKSGIVRTIADKTVNVFVSFKNFFMNRNSKIYKDIKSKFMKKIKPAQKINKINA